MKRKLHLLLAVAALVGGLSAGLNFIKSAKSNLVTLDVRKMDLRDVVRKIEWQTWESIFVHTNLAGAVTLNVRNMPLEQVLELIAEQTGGHSATFYPLYSSDESLAELKSNLLGEQTGGWTNLHAAGARPSRFGPGSNGLVSLNIIAQDLNFAALAFNRFAHLRVVPEDGANETVSVVLNEATPEKALDALARKANLHWTQLYSLRAPNPRGVRPSLDAEQAAERQVLNEQLLATLPEDQRAAFEQRRNFFVGMR